MSCVIGLVTEQGNVILGADSAANDGNVLIPNLYEKIVTHTISVWPDGPDTIDLAIGTCGSTQIGSIVRNFLELPRLDNPRLVLEYMQTSFLMALMQAISASGYEREIDPAAVHIGGDEILVAINGYLVFIDQNMGISANGRGFDAIGSGREIALGSLQTTHIIKDSPDAQSRVLGALDVVSELSINVAGPYQLVEVKRIKYE